MMETGNFLGSPIIMLVIIFALFYFLIILPQKKKQREMKNMLESLKKGDKVITQGGIVGTISSITDDEIQLKVSENVKITFLKNAILAKKPEETQNK